MVYEYKRTHMKKSLVKMIGTFGLLGGCGSSHQATSLIESHGVFVGWMDVAATICRFAISRLSSSDELDRCPPERRRGGGVNA